ncbi:unnamed protein product [Oikopleura dioica]|uniref:Uncharacterized protein n=1 Tax=Oikopleura dioica TaxID=34765 RepID=E4WWQ1_OIKDI|nr:unnamed protein product [Oikopleura dioica]
MTSESTERKISHCEKTSSCTQVLRKQPIQAMLVKRQRKL